MAPTLGLLPHVPPTSSPLAHPIPVPAVTTATTTTTCTASSSLSSAATATMTTSALPIPLVPSLSRPQAAHSSTSLVSNSGRTSVPTPSPLSASTGATAATPAHSSDDLYESLHSQMVVDSVAKLASLSSNNIIGNPRVILPHNMSTILAVAALQKSKAQGTPSTPASLTSSISHRGKSASLVNSPSAHLLASRAHHGLGAGSAHLSTSLFKEHGKVSPVDYTRYVKRFSSSTECGHNSCKDLNYREHFHCLDCNSRVFVKKEEMIRHFKWHKKRDESLQHGFLRYSPMDDCSERYPNCAHNRKQTHYHCVKENCDKVYISTSDVQMHANYHRKDSAIIQEGFQRFRATEDCATSYCSFAGQRTTHFHCRRPSCNFTFKNKADMEKHKSYHIKDEQLNKDGFKKFMKHEHCSFENCRFSRVCNHIHCIRPGCTYVLHSSGQLYSHKRKHERRETEMAYRKYKLAQSMMRTLGENQMLALQSFGDELKASDAFSSQLPMSVIPTGPGGLPMSLTPPSTHGLTPDSTTLSFTDAVQQSFTSALLAAGGSQHLDSALSAHSLVPGPEHLGMVDFTAELLKSRMDDSWKKYLSRYTANDPCKVNCEYIYKDHYHCNAENCSLVFRSKDGVREHARNHETQDQVTEAFYTTVDVGQTGLCPPDCPHQSEERHYHCGWHGCREIILSTDKPFRRLDHYKMHDYSQKLNFSKEFSSKDPLSLHFASSIEGIFKRKRGRPPKNRVIEFPVTSGSSDFPQAIYTSFKLPKPNNMSMMSSLEKGFPSGSSALMAGFTSATSKSVTSPVHSMFSPMGYLTQNIISPKVEMQDGFYVFPEGASCPLPGCPFYGKLHYHCAQSRCFYVTERSDILLLHSKDFHENIDIMEGFVFFDRSVDCRLPGCQSNRVNRHFHCTRPNCHYTFVRYSTMSQHDEKHRNAEGAGTVGMPPSSSLAILTAANSVGCSSGGALPTKRSPMHPIKMECPSPPAITSPGTQLSEPRTTPSPGSSNGKPTVVKATGTYYPLSAFPQTYRTKEGVKPASSSRATSTSDAATDTEPMSSSNTNDQDLNAMRLAAEWQALLDSHVAYSTEKSCGRPFCKLHNRDHVHCTYCNKAFSKLMQLQPHIQKHMGAMSPTGNSSRMTNSEDDLSDHRLDEDDDDMGMSDPRRRSHEETSDDSNCSSTHFASQMRSSPSTDSTPSSQHLTYSASFLAASTAAAAATGGHPGSDLFPTFPSSVPAGPLGSATPGLNFTMPGENHSRISPHHHNGSSGEFEGEHSSHDSMAGSGAPSPIDSLDSDPGASPPLLLGSTPSAVARKRPSVGGRDPDSPVDSKRSKIPCLRLLKDEPVPKGYVRYRFNEDCQYSHCGYREHQTHFHCMRKDCGYSFCDKTRFVQHTARHERLDTLMGGDFQQFRANISCGRPNCIYSMAPGAVTNKASHFHCFKCEFVCTDTNKVVAHRRQHQKLDTIMAAGFEKFTAAQACNIDGCSHNQRQTHYHCLKCQYAVLGLSQMSAHKYRHAE